MNRIPPALLYLTIYNPTIRPTISTVSQDDEDAEEQAQILFYTSRDQAVSRDKMLRQVGLAKALVHFAEIFHSTGPCQNVHSQSKRMITLRLEPNFWMHAAIELARTMQAPQTKTKGKGKAKEISQDAPLPPEYHDNSLHDSAVRAHLLQGYEAFKITHGSFTSILSSQGQRALESQLERFFTIWAWSWNLETGLNLVEDLGLPLHPLYQAILPAIDTFSSNLPDGLMTVVLTPEYIAPSSAYRKQHYPTALARHLMMYISRTRNEASTTQSDPMPLSDLPTNGTRIPPTAELHTSNGFLGIPSVAMDIRKWGWPGGFSSSRSPDTKPGTSTPAEPCSLPRSITDGPVVQFDRSALEDAVSTNSFGSAEKVEKESVHEDVGPSITEEDLQEDIELQGPSLPDVDTPRPSRASSPMSPPSETTSSSHQVDGDNKMASLETTSGSHQANGGSKMPPNTYFTSTSVFIAPNDDPLATVRRTVFLIKANNITLALLSGELGDKDVEALIPSVTRLFDEIDEMVAKDAKQRLDSSLPSVSTILQPRDSHIMTVQDYVFGGTGISFGSDHLYDAKELLDKQPTMVEVFSRSLNPQHWHAIHRGNERGDIYLQVARKETSLSDVDNILQKLYKSYS
ncbi:hypothetical protein V8B97DRAFT_1869777 [Scleroderma yunnanense]